MPTDTVHQSSNATRFVLRSVVGGVALFGLLRLGWFEAHVLLPLTRGQGTLAAGLFGAPTAPMAVTLACGGAEALAACFGATLAYPASWRLRLAGLAGGAALILTLNTLRIGTLGRVAASPASFDLLHLYLWPFVLTLAIVGYVFAWMHWVDRRRVPSHGAIVAQAGGAAWLPRRPRRLLVLTMALLGLFLAASPLYLESAWILALAGLVARGAAAMLAVVGVSAYAAGNVLWTSHGGFLITQECVATPLIPIYLATVLTYAPTWWRVTLYLIATLPLFMAFSVVRLLAVALPAAAGPIFFVHAFYQLVVAALVVCLVALWRHGGRAGVGHALAGLVTGGLLIYLIGPFYTPVVMYPAGTLPPDPQGALALLPAFQVGLYLALWVAGFMAVAWPRVLAGIAALGLTQSAGLWVLHAVNTQAGLTLNVSSVRGWALAAPVLVLAAVIANDRATR